VVGTPVPVLEPIHVSPTGVPILAVSRDGTLVYVPARVFDERRVVWIDRDGAVTPVLEEPLYYLMAQISPDGRRALIQIQDGEANHDIWALDFERGALSRQTRGYNYFPVWSPDGARLAFGSMNLYWKPVDGTGEPEILLEKEFVQRPYSFSPDGAFLTISEEHPETGWDIWILSIEEGEATPFSVTPAAERTPMFSPDGKWIAYESNESGRDEIYVRSFLDSGRRHQISTNGGFNPRWSRNGRELFFIERGRLVAVPMDAGDGLSAGPSQALFRVRSEEQYDVSADGTRFLVCQRVGDPELHVVLNWSEELKRAVPAN
jgi:dipeptidyl aminopeptidase/acylaminoacyl peptidase